MGFAALIYGLLILFSERIAFPSIQATFLIFLLTFLGYLMRGARWKLLLKKNGMEIGYSDAVKTFIAGLAFIITPGKLGEVAKSELMKEKYGFKRKKIIFLTVVERAFDIFANLIIAFFGATAIASQFLKNFLFLLLGFILISLLIYLFRGKIKMVEEEIASLGDPKLIVSCLFISILAWGIEGIEVWILAKDFEFNLSILKSLFAFSASLIFGNLTMLPGGLGSAEAALITLLSMYGIEKGIASIITIAVRLSTFWFGFFLGSLFWFLLGMSGRNESTDN